MLYLLTARVGAIVGLYTAVRFVLDELFREVNHQFRSFSYAAALTSTNRDGGSRVVFLYFCLSSFIHEHIKIELFSDFNN